LMSGLKPGPISGATAVAAATTRAKAEADSRRGMTERKAKATTRNKAGADAGSFPFARSRVRMTARNEQRQRPRQGPLQGSFAALEDDEILGGVGARTTARAAEEALVGWGNCRWGGVNCRWGGG
jgi:hypothetical protein